MRKDYVDMVLLEPSSTMDLDGENRFEINTKSKFLWLQKLCFKLLDLLNCRKKDYIIKYNRITIDKKLFFNNLLKYSYELSRTFNITPKYLLLGPELFSELSLQIIPPNYKKEILFDIEYEVCYKGYMLHVIIIPWMDGYLLLPNDFNIGLQK